MLPLLPRRLRLRQRHPGPSSRVHGRVALAAAGNYGKSSNSAGRDIARKEPFIILSFVSLVSLFFKSPGASPQQGCWLWAAAGLRAVRVSDDWGAGVKGRCSRQWHGSVLNGTNLRLGSGVTSGGRDLSPKGPAGAACRELAAPNPELRPQGTTGMLGWKAT